MVGMLRRPGYYVGLLLLLILTGCAGRDWICRCESTILGTTYSRDYLLENQTRREAQRICDFLQQEENWETCTVSEI